MSVLVHTGSRGRKVALLVTSATLLASSLIAPARAANFTAMAIVGAEPLAVGAPVAKCTTRACKLAKYTKPAMPAGLPTPAVESRVMMGIVTDVARQGGQIVQWKIGTGGRSQWVFAKIGSRIDGRVPMGSEVKVITVRRARNVLRPLIVDRITNTAQGQRFPTAGAGAPVVEKGFLWNGTVEAVADAWTISDANNEVEFDMSTDPEHPTEIDGVGQGDRVTVDFIAG